MDTIDELIIANNEARTLCRGRRRCDSAQSSPVSPFLSLKAGRLDPLSLLSGSAWRMVHQPPISQTLNLARRALEVWLGDTSPYLSFVSNQGPNFRSIH